MTHLRSFIEIFKYYQLLAEKTFEQLNEADLFKKPSQESNSIAIIVNHLSGNMLSRWTDFLTTDGEKPWRKRDGEFEDFIQNKRELLQKWDSGWSTLYSTLLNLEENDLDKIVYIRNNGQTVFEAISRQLAHYSYHIGQIVFIGKTVLEDQWISLSIPKGGSESFNQERFDRSQTISHFTEDSTTLLRKEDDKSQ